ncbi:MAG: phospholipid carrier-dependent glycosyltransferase [Candidatus Bathyarchaeia archaeon]
MAMKIDKRDLMTAVTLSLVFLLTSTWNLGMNNVPISTWRADEGGDFYLDLGNVEEIREIHFLIKRGEVKLKIYTGHPGNWGEEKKASFDGYYRWREINICNRTQFVRFVFERSAGEIAEIAFSDGKGRKTAVAAIVSSKGEEKALGRLVDEQEKVKFPLTYMSQTYFDEIYYVRTVEDYMNLRDPYESTHPPLGKLLMAAGILTFGYSPFGWRIMSVIFADLMIVAIYFCGKKMFGTWIGAFTPAFLLTFDFMHFTMGRIATVDTFAVFFSTISHFFFFAYFQEVLRNGWNASTFTLFLAVVFFSLGFATKWYVLYGFFGQIILLLALRFRDILTLKAEMSAKLGLFFSHPFLTTVGFVSVGVGIYFSTFIPYMMIGHTIEDVYVRQWSMYVYHLELTATHPFSSQWWSWPIILRPVWLYISYLPGNMLSTIAAMGNPAVWWSGFVSMIPAVYKAFREKDYANGFVVTIFFSQWFPYMLVERCLFIYHFYTNVPFLCLAITYFLSKSCDTARGKTVGLAYLTGVASLFVLFYPAISGHPAPCWWIDHLRWLKTWIF